MSMQTRLIPLVILLFFIVSCTHDDKKTVAYNVIILKGTEFNYQMPDTVPAGYNLIRLINTGSIWHEALIFRFINDSFSIRQYVSSVEKGIDFPPCAIDIGGPGMTVAKDSNEVIMNLMPGRHGIVCTIDNHLMAGMYKEFYVVNKSSSPNEPPKEDNVLTLTDSTFMFSKPISAGEHLIKVVNKGQQNHEVDFIKLNAGKTKDDYIKWFHNRSDDPSAVPVGGTLDIFPGGEVWVPIKLKKGNYYLSCMVPNAGTGKAHLDMGTIGEFSIK